MTDEMFNVIPPFNTAEEKRKKPKSGEKVMKGIWVGTGETKQLVDPEVVWKLAALGCTDAEICDWFGISSSTLRFNFSSYMVKARSQLKLRLRQAQMNAALGGSIPMMIWLGKNILGQSDSGLSDQSKPVLPWNNDTEDKADAVKPNEAQ